MPTLEERATDYVADKAQEALDAAMDYIVPNSNKNQPSKADNNRTVSIVGADGMAHLTTVRYLRASAGRVWDAYKVFKTDPAMGRELLQRTDLPVVVASSRTPRVDEKWLKSKQVKTRFGWKTLLWLAVSREGELKEILGLSNIPTPQLPIWRSDDSTAPYTPPPNGLIVPETKSNSTVYLLVAAVVLFVLMGRK